MCAQCIPLVLAQILGDDTIVQIVEEEAHITSPRDISLSAKNPDIVSKMLQTGLDEQERARYGPALSPDCVREWGHKAEAAITEMPWLFYIVYSEETETEIAQTTESS